MNDKRKGHLASRAILCQHNGMAHAPYDVENIFLLCYMPEERVKITMAYDNYQSPWYYTFINVKNRISSRLVLGH